MSAPDQNESAAGEEIRLLREIRDLLAVPRQAKPPLWRQTWLWLFVIGLACLFVLDFPSESARRADLVVTDGARLALQVLPDPDWASLGVPARQGYRAIPDLMDPSVTVNALLEVSLVRQGRTYRHSALRILRSGNGLSCDLLGDVTIQGPTTIVVRRIGEAEKESAMLRAIVTHYAVHVDRELVPLSSFVGNESFEGQLVVESRPPWGLERFRSNLERAFGLIF